MLNLTNALTKKAVDWVKSKTGWRCSGCGSKKPIGWYWDNGFLSCCPERKWIFRGKAPTK